MTEAYRRLALTLLLVVVAAIGGAWIGGRLFSPAPPTHSEFHQELYRTLDLTTEQYAALEALKETKNQEEALHHEALRQANHKLANLLEHEDAYNENVEAAIEEIHTQMNSLQVLTIQHLYAMRDTLTPEQQAEFDQLVAGTLREHAK